LITLTVNNLTVSIDDGSTVAAAIFHSGTDAFRRSVGGQPRGPLCGMGICFECRVTINGVHHRRSCQVIAEEGMAIKTDE
jgi:sarcosine oxidase subunit alpha